MSTYHCNIGGKWYGPISFEKLIEYASNRTITADTPISIDGGGSVAAAEVLKGRFEFATAPHVRPPVSHPTAQSTSDAPHASSYKSVPSPGYTSHSPQQPRATFVDGFPREINFWIRIIDVIFFVLIGLTTLFFAIGILKALSDGAMSFQMFLAVGFCFVVMMLFEVILHRLSMIFMRFMRAIADSQIQIRDRIHGKS